MKKMFILFVAILASCTTPEIEQEKTIVKVCYDIIGIGSGGATDWILVDVNGRAEKYAVKNAKDYYKAQICDLSNLKRLPL